MQVGVLTISDRAARGEYKDTSGPLIVEILEQSGWSIAEQAIVSDDLSSIVEMLNAWCDAGYNLILTSGGTGLSQRDVTPEATRQVIEREVPGIAEALRYESLKVTRHAMLSRAVAGTRGNSLIVNLPGSPKAVRENLEVLLPVLPHALEILTGASAAEAGHVAA